MMVVMEKELGIAKQLAVAGGGILLEYYDQAVLVDWKAPGDPVTAADRAVNEFIVTNLAREFPSHGILSEEEIDDYARLGRSHVWMIDPMDGTKEFIDHRGDFAVQIGLAVDGL